MDEREWLTQQFEQHRARLRAVAYRMLGSLSDADDAVQDAWLRLDRTQAAEVDNLGGWLTTVVARVCLNMLRSRSARREDPLDYYVPDPLVQRDGESDPANQALLADSVSLALLVLLETLSPAERLVFVLHDLFGLPYDEIAPVVGSTPSAARQLASRARRRVKGAELRDDNTDPLRQRAIVDAFFAATRAGDLEALVRVLHPDAVLRIDGGTAFPSASMVVRGAGNVAAQSGRGMKSLLARPEIVVHAAVVNGAPGVIVTVAGKAVTVMGFTVDRDRILEIDSISDPARVAGLTLAICGD
jgi:RNA polymerase sigma factor (sigma-70 family)